MKRRSFLRTVAGILLAPLAATAGVARSVGLAGMKFNGPGSHCPINLYHPLARGLAWYWDGRQSWTRVGDQMVLTKGSPLNRP